MTHREYWELRALFLERRMKASSDRLILELMAAYKAVAKEISSEIKGIKEEGNYPSDYMETHQKRVLELILKRLDELAYLVDMRTGVHLRQVYEEAWMDSAAVVSSSVKRLQGSVALPRLSLPGLGLGLSFPSLNERAIRAAVEEPWSGKSYSRRIWGNRKKAARKMKTVMISGIARGLSIDEMAKALSKPLDANLSDAKRLIRTESNYCLNQGTKQSYKDMGIRKYRFLATLDHKTSVACADLDSTVHMVEESVVGVNYPPMHPNCRSTTVPYMPEYEDKEMDTRIARGVDGRNYLVPGSLDYKRWYASLSSHEKDQAKVQAKMQKNRKRDEKQFE